MRRVLVVGCLLLAAHGAAAGDVALESRLKSFRPAADARHLVARPFHLEDEGRVRAAGTLAATVAAYAWRDAVRDVVWDGSDGHRVQAAETARDLLGKGATAPVLALAFATASAFTKNEREKRTAILLLESAAFSFAAAGVGSFVLASERPRDGNEVRLFRGGGHGVSADVALAASLVAPIRRSYLLPRPDETRGARLARRAAVGALYAGASLVALQRMDADAHWLPDVALGMAGGLTVGGILCDARGLRGPSLAVTAGPGVALRWSWAPGRGLPPRNAPGA